jgi:uncharacterized membrane protein YphA (DoxX/SURF4 family)
MKVPAFISRILLGVIFIVYGANGFFRFGHTDPFATPIAREYMTVMLATPYGHILFGLQIACGLLLIAGVFVPVSLTILAGYIFNIYMFHIFLDQSKSLSTVAVTVFWMVTFVSYRPAFRALLHHRALGR